MTRTFKSLMNATALALAVSAPLALPTATPALSATTTSAASDVAYRSETINGISVAYREAGDPDRPTVLLLHGFPTSSYVDGPLLAIAVLGCVIECLRSYVRPVCAA